MGNSTSELGIKIGTKNPFLISLYHYVDVWLRSDKQNNWCKFVKILLNQTFPSTSYLIRHFTNIPTYILHSWSYLPQRKLITCVWRLYLFCDCISMRQLIINTMIWLWWVMLFLSIYLSDHCSSVYLYILCYPNPLS